MEKKEIELTNELLKLKKDLEDEKKDSNIEKESLKKKIKDLENSFKLEIEKLNKENEEGKKKINERELF